MDQRETPLYYADYLQLNKLLSSQSLKSVEHGRPAHDEMLFIIVHQVYELWFKQILHELDSVITTFDQESVDEKQIGVAVARLGRITEIQKLLIDQLRVIETMTALDFLDFRDLLYPASGFQSYQFRLLENKLGMKPDHRLPYNQEVYYAHLSPDHQGLITRSEQEPTLFEGIERWLKRTPFLDFHGFNFWEHYRTAVQGMLQFDLQTIRNNQLSTDEQKKRQLAEVDKNQANFDALLDERKHDELVKENKRRLSQKATLAALLIELYRDEPILHLPFRLLTALKDMDEQWTTWRYRHALMVQRMIGNKIGTGGSSGHSYLKATTEEHKIFVDLFNLSTFLIPRSKLPELPEEVKKNLDFHYSRKK
jgi:tryptophan 2,3-dioxygenase